jgi:hypothetical protein
MSTSELEKPYENVKSWQVVSEADYLIRTTRSDHSLEEVRHFQRDLAPAIQAIHALGEREYVRVRQDVLLPQDTVLVYANSWLREMYRAALGLGRPWLRPHVTANVHGEVVFEWWRGPKKLTVYVSGETVEYVKVWGADIESEMAEGDASTDTSRRRLWDWLTS